MIIIEKMVVKVRDQLCLMDGAINEFTGELQNLIFFDIKQTGPGFEPEHIKFKEIKLPFELDEFDFDDIRKHISQHGYQEQK